MSEWTVRLEAFFFILARLMFVEAVLSVSAIGEVAALDDIKKRKDLLMCLFYDEFCH